MNKYCQSCSMPMAQDKQGGGTNADGSKNMDYCSLCYTSGQFTEPDLTVDQMKAKVKGIIKEKMHVPGFIAGIFTMNIPKLKRWSK